MVSFKDDIRRLFTDIDVEHMNRHHLNLADYGEVKNHARHILDRLKGVGGPVMPPPPQKHGDGPWPQERIDLFAQWIAEGCQP